MLDLDDRKVRRSLLKMGNEAPDLDSRSSVPAAQRKRGQTGLPGRWQAGFEDKPNSIHEAGLRNGKYYSRLAGLQDESPCLEHQLGVFLASTCRAEKECGGVSEDQRGTQKGRSGYSCNRRDSGRFRLNVVAHPLCCQQTSPSSSAIFVQRRVLHE